MIQPAAGMRVYLACQPVDLRKGFDGLSAQVVNVLADDPLSGHLFVFRGKRGDYVKLLWWDGSGLCLFAKRLEKGRFVWPPIVDGRLQLTPAQLAPHGCARSGSTAGASLKPRSQTPLR